MQKTIANNDRVEYNCRMQWSNITWPIFAAAVIYGCPFHIIGPILPVADAFAVETPSRWTPSGLSNPSPGGLHVVVGVQCREVINRDLPIVDTVTVLEATAASQEMLVDQVLAAGEEDSSTIRHDDPYGAVLWPAGWAVAKYLLEEEENIHRLGAQTDETRLNHGLSSMHVLELGTGTGLVSLSLAKAGAASVVATDYEPLALELTAYAARELMEIGPNVLHTQLLDLCDFDTPLPLAVTSHRGDGYHRLVVAADVMYEKATGRAVARRVIEALKKNCRVVVGDSPGRAGRPAFLEELQSLGLPPQHCRFEEIVGRTCVGPRHDLICGKGSTSVSSPEEEGLYRELSVAILDLKPPMLVEGGAL